MSSVLDRLLKWLSIAELAVIVLCFVAMTSVLLADVGARTIFGSGVFGANFFFFFFLILAAMLSFDVAVCRGAHLRPTVFDALLPEAWDATLRRLGNLLSAGIALLIVWGCWIFVGETRFFGETNPTVGMPLWPVQVPLVVGFGFSALRHLTYAVLPALAPAKAGAVE